MQTILTATAAVLAAPATAAADRAPDAPDFHQAHAVRGDVDRTTAASDATGPMSPVDLIHFGLDSVTLDAVDRVQIRAAAVWLASHPEHELVVEGHTDDAGPDTYNRWLAEQRAAAVGDFLLEAGVPADRLYVVAYGEDRPVSPSAATNRRVRIWARE